MSWANLTLEQGLDLVSRVYLIKQADRESALRRSHAARQELGTLGVNEGQLNSLVDQHRRGDIGDISARARFTGLIPNPVSQAVNIPGAVATAASQGRLGDAAAQLDVVGLKNAPTVVAGLPALGMGLGGYFASKRLQDNKDMERLRHGVLPAKQDHLKAVLGGNKGQEQLLTDYRSKNTYQGLVGKTWNGATKGYTTGGVTGAATGAGDSLVKGVKNWWAGPKAITNRVKPTPADPKGMAATARIGRNELRRALASYRAEVGPSRIPMLAALASAATPLAFREWFAPGGYRSGRNPFSQLLDSNTELAQGKK